MKITQTSTMPKNNSTKLSDISQINRNIFDQVVELLKPYSKKLDVRSNTTFRYELWTNHGFRSRSMHPTNKKGFLFAGVLVLKKEIGFYFYPLHVNVDFKNRIDFGIIPLWRGGSAFHICEPLSDLELDMFRLLLLNGWNFYVEMGWVPREKM